MKNAAMLHGWALLLASALNGLHAQGTPPVPKGEARQVVDTAFAPLMRNAPTFRRNAGPTIVIDEAHNNFHTVAGRYRPFARLAEADGFRVVGGKQRLDSASLSSVRVLVIANALNARNERQADWHLPNPSALDSAEIAATVAWIRRGGALLLIADHMPFAGAAMKLAAAMEVHFSNGYALLGEADDQTGDYPIIFRRSDGTLRAHPITDGRNRRERIDSLESFTGSAFRVVRDGSPNIMVLPAGTRVMMPVDAWKFSDSTAMVAGDGMLQGAAFKLGRGRVAVFGEAAMFSAQRKGMNQAPMGMNAAAAEQNPQFILNVLHWLVKLYE